MELPGNIYRKDVAQSRYMHNDIDSIETYLHYVDSYSCFAMAIVIYDDRAFQRLPGNRFSCSSP